MFKPNQFQYKHINKGISIALISSVFLLCLAVTFTLANFFDTDWATNNVTMSGAVNIQAVGIGNSNIENDTETGKLVIDLDDKYDVLIPGMPIEIIANCMVFQSNTKPLIRAMLSVDLIDKDTGESFDEDSTYETARLMVAQGIMLQMNDVVEANGWYLHTDSYYYYVGTTNFESNTALGANAVLFEVDAIDANTVVPFLDSEIKFPTNVTSTYSGLGCQVEITFQAIQNYIPDDDGYPLDNTIKNSYKIFNNFTIKNYTPTPLEYFTLTYNADGTEATLSIPEGVELPETLVLPTEDANGVPITTIPGNFLKGNTTVKNVIIPYSYTKLNPGAFDGTYAETIDLSYSQIKTISSYAFASTSHLKNVLLGPSVEIIDSYAFHNNSLKSIVLPETVTTINSGAFNMLNLNALYIPASVTYIADSALSNANVLMRVDVDSENENYYDVDNYMLCSYNGVLLNLIATYQDSSVDIPEGIKTITSSAMNNSSNVRNVNYSSTIETIESFPPNLESFTISENNTHIISPTGHELIYTSDGSMFKFCVGNLINYVVPDECSIINNNIFRSVTLNALTIGANVSKVYSNTFSSMKVSEIYVNELNSYLYADDNVALICSDGLFCLYSYTNKSTEYIVPLGVTTIGFQSFFCNMYLEKLTIQTGCTSFISGWQTFSGCTNLSYIVLPKTLNSMGYQVFVNTGLIQGGTIIFESETPPTINSFGAIRANIYVPDSAVNTYKTTSPYSSYSSQIFGISSYTGS